MEMMLKDGYVLTEEQLRVVLPFFAELWAGKRKCRKKDRRIRRLCHSAGCPCPPFGHADPAGSPL